MTIDYGPFDAGLGGSKTENFWRKMADKWLGTGVIAGSLNELAVYADSTGMQVKVKSGLAWIRGHLFVSDAEVILPISGSDGTNPRITRVVLSADFGANSISLLTLDGVPAGSPAPPSLTQTEDVLWQIPLAQVAVGAGVSTITAGNVTDERPIMQPDLGTQSVISLADQSRGSTTLTNDPELWFWAEPNAVYDVELRVLYEAPVGGDIKLGWAVPAGATGTWGGIGPQVSAASGDTSSLKQLATPSIANPLSFGGLDVSRTDMLRIWAVIHNGSAAGRVSLQLAQDTNSGTTKRHPDSLLRARRVA